MKIENIIKSNINTVSKNNIAVQLGYTSNKKALIALDKFIDSKNLYEWLHSGYFDFKYTAVAFFKKLCEILDIDKSIVGKTLFEDEKYHAELEKFRYSHIFIHTNFKRKNEPIFALAFLESQRRLKVPIEDLLFKTEKEVLAIVKDFIIKHYYVSKGDLGIWGKVVNYVFHHNKNQYIFDTEGNRLFNMNISESIATLKLK